MTSAYYKTTIHFELLQGLSGEFKIVTSFINDSNNYTFNFNTQLQAETLKYGGVYV